MTTSILLLHGLYTGNWIMQPLAFRLKQQGFTTHLFGYRSTRQTLPEHAAALAHELERLYDNKIDRLHFVAHSLGGLVLRHLAAMRPDLIKGRIVTIGTPHQGSAVAGRLYHSALLSRVLGQTYRHALDGKLPALPQGIELGSLAGNHGVGLGKIFHIAGCNDGTVAVEETYCNGMQDHIVLPVTHTGMLFNQDVANQISVFLHYGHFIRPQNNQ
ncbi:esterase/lipase family protein [Neisseria montereyensis]|uniref:Alpha/beta fold hydrolase n=1 Tax=Neisseria montereyensis TaxID=2973938 RepID=A0ABT2FCI1_9NEIS|nr:alpha/beta fold hydrolase [Neisseria montereyensis]MCS4533238.1 alpha/beta fold hydrolase [Neisseria montereyensis]